MSQYEHGEGLREPFDETCGFCAEIHGVDRENNLLRTHITPQTGLESRVILETEHFQVIPTLGGFVEGYVMVVSRNHYDCVGKVPAADLPELKALLEEVKGRIRRCYGTGTVCFEHGSVSCTNRFGGCINHAHVHIVPCGASLLEDIRCFGLDCQSIDDLEALRAYGADGTPYLYFEDVDQRKYLITGDAVISQFFRKLLADHHGVPERWDWRTDLFMDNIEKTICTLKDC